jgi:hypothetical protein
MNPYSIYGAVHDSVFHLSPLRWQILGLRKYVVTDPNSRGGTVVENFGDPLPGESNAFKHSDQLRIVLEIATSLGIKTNYTEQEIRVYAAIERDKSARSR